MVTIHNKSDFQWAIKRHQRTENAQEVSTVTGSALLTGDSKVVISSESYH